MCKFDRNVQDRDLFLKLEKFIGGGIYKEKGDRYVTSTSLVKEREPEYSYCDGNNFFE